MHRADNTSRRGFLAALCGAALWLPSLARKRPPQEQSESQRSRQEEALHGSARFSCGDNVGIRTSSPATRLDVHGCGASSGIWICQERT